MTPLYQQKLALTLPTSGGHSVGIVRSRTQATEFFSVLLHLAFNLLVSYSFSYLAKLKSNLGMNLIYQVSEDN
jgi:hypothetical protein